MTALMHAYKPNLVHIAITKTCDTLFDKLIPRPCMVVSVGLIITGLTIPLLMVVQLLSLNYPLIISGFAMVSIGGVMALFFCGEI